MKKFIAILIIIGTIICIIRSTAFSENNSYLHKVNYTPCKSEKVINNAVIEFRMKQDRILEIHQSQLQLNCCIDNIVAEVSHDKNQIMIIIREVGGDCYCLCRYDIDYKILIPANSNFFTITLTDQMKYNKTVKYDIKFIENTNVKYSIDLTSK